jgi:hypothetical protein
VGGAGQIRRWVLGVKSRSQVRKRGKIGFNQTVMYIHPFPPLSPQLCLPFINSAAKKEFLRQTKFGGEGGRGHLPPPPSPKLCMCKAYLRRSPDAIFHTVPRLHAEEQGNLGSILDMGRDFSPFYSMWTSSETSPAFCQMVARMIMWPKSLM